MSENYKYVETNFIILTKKNKFERPFDKKFLYPNIVYVYPLYEFILKNKSKAPPSAKPLWVIS